jgi:glycosyltransferase involved in cell wall biosynthesis
MNRPLVSVLIPVYNGEKYLGKAIESVLAQTYRPHEIIVVDDGSVDGSAEIARAYKEVHYIYQNNQGKAAALNAGIEASRGEFVAFLDADDLWAPEKLSLQIGYLLEHPEVGYVTAHMRNFLEPGAELPSPLTKDFMPTDYAALTTGLVVVRKSLFEKVGRFGTGYVFAEDVDWFVRAKEAGIVMATLPETLLFRRLHGSNQSYHAQERLSYFLRAVRSSIERKRMSKIKESPGEEDGDGGK